MRLLLLVILLGVAHAYPVPPSYPSLPPLPTEFYGTVIINDENSTPLHVGTLVEAFASTNPCGKFTVSDPGRYGLLTCRGDVTGTPDAEGAVQGQNIVFMVNNESTVPQGDTVFYAGEFHYVNLTLSIRCGNTYCEITESCVTCAEDCGFCPPSQNTTEENQTGGGEAGDGGDTGETDEQIDGGGGSSGGASGGGGSSSSGSSSSSYLTGEGAGRMNMSICIEDWLCGEWTPAACPIDEIQTRKCFDNRSCGTNFSKPELNQKCIYLGTCFDVILNQDETDVDCGGKVCEKCEEGLHCKTPDDCLSGFCDPRGICRMPSCDDGYLNQGETGVDCGGPCDPCEEKASFVESPMQLYVLAWEGCGSFPWWIAAMLSGIMLTIFALGHALLFGYMQTNGFKSHGQLWQLMRAYHIRRILTIFAMSGSAFVVTLSLYLHLFCTSGLYFYMIMMIVLPSFAVVLIKFLSYDEDRKEEFQHKMHDEHLEQMHKVRHMEQRALVQAKKKIRELATEGEGEIQALLRDVQDGLERDDLHERVSKFVEKKEDAEQLGMKDAVVLCTMVQKMLENLEETAEIKEIIQEKLDFDKECEPLQLGEQKIATLGDALRQLARSDEHAPDISNWLATKGYSGPPEKQAMIGWLLENAIPKDKAVPSAYLKLGEGIIIKEKGELKLLDEKTYDAKAVEDFLRYSLYQPGFAEKVKGKKRQEAIDIIFGV